MKSSNTLFTKYRGVLASLWLGCCIICTAAIVIWGKQIPVNSSVLALLPNNTLGNLPKGIEEAFLNRLDGQMIWLIQDNQHHAAAAQFFADGLSHLPELTVKASMSQEELDAWGKYYFTYRSNLLDDQSKLRLMHDGQQQAEWIMSQVYSAFSGVSSKELAYDPLLLVRAKQLELQKTSKKIMLQQGWLSVRDDDGNSWYILRGELSSAYTMATAHRIVQSVREIEDKLSTQYPEAKVLERGTLFYSDYASQQAQHDISHLGTTTLLAVIALIVSVFRSLRPLLLCLFSVMVGAVVGMLVTYAIFGEVHLMTLVMSLSLIGLSVDYGLYFLTERMVHGNQETPFSTVDKISRTLIQALFTVIAAYLIIMLAPFPGLRQLAVFAAAGLTASCLTVILLFPYLVQRLPVRSVPFQRILCAWIHLWTRSRFFYKWAVGIVVTVMLICSLFVHVNDDIATFQTLPAALAQQDKKITALTGQSTEQKWFIVYGHQPQETLERVELLNTGLMQAKQAQLISDYRLFPLPSLKMQKENTALVQQTMPSVIQQLNKQGLVLHDAAVKEDWITPEQWLHSNVSEGWRLAYISLPDQTTAVLIPVDGVKDTAQLAQLATQYPGVVWVDRKAGFDHLFSFYRSLLTLLLVVIVCVICIYYCIRLGIKKRHLVYCSNGVVIGGGLVFSGDLRAVFKFIFITGANFSAGYWN